VCVKKKNTGGRGLGVGWGGGRGHKGKKSRLPQLPRPRHHPKKNSAKF